MATNSANPWAGAGCDQAWNMTGSSFAQATNWNYGESNPCGLLFKQGSSSLTGNMISAASDLVATGNSAYANSTSRR